VHLSSVLSDKVLYSWGDNEDFERKVIVISSCLLEDIDYVTKIALLASWAAEQISPGEKRIPLPACMSDHFLKASSWANRTTLLDANTCTNAHLILRTPTKELVSSYQKHVLEFKAKLVATLKYATSTEQTYSVIVNKGDDVGNHIEQKPCRKDKRCYLGVLLSKVMERFRACPDLWDPWILKKPISSFKKDVIDRVHVKGTPEDKSNSSNDVWEDWYATSIDWEISDNDEENCEREHDGKIFDMTLDTSLASPATPNTIVSIKSIAKIVADDMSGDYGSGMDVDVNVSRPFTMAQAAYDGLQLEDQIMKFRDVEYGDNLLPKLASEAHKNQGRLVLMLVMKQGTSINLAVKPRTWRHRGLLGSHQIVESFHKQVKVIVALQEIESYITIIVTKGLAQLGLSDAMGFESISLAQSRLVITLLTRYLDKAILFAVGKTLVCDDLEEAKIVIERLSLENFHRVQVNIALSTM
nr:hypothetical protein [Tanacetum cinerariifolium]